MVEDYIDNRDLLLMFLDELNCQIDCVENGQEFLDKISEQDQDYDIVLMDCQMPILDGYEATRQFRQQEGNQKHTIIIGLTAHAMESDRQKCLEAGMDDYLCKPFMQEELLDLLQKWIDFSKK
ncbi:MAG: response regulator [Cyanobacteria bacterium J06592_8]